jgi:hypothetical protein
MFFFQNHYNMVKEEKKLRISGFDLEFMPWALVEFKD